MSINEFDPFAQTGAWSGEEAQDEKNPGPSPGVLAAIGRYRVERLLGKGGFGQVFLATDAELRRSVAIKVPDPQLVARTEDVELYLAEARTVAALDHPHIVPVYDVGSCAEFPCYVVSRFVAGGDLSQPMKDSRLSWRESAELVAMIADALHYAHTHGVVHRDIKPGNILLGTAGTAYLTDFGLALKEVNIGRGPELVGTPAYMSPEQALGEGHRVDGRSDVFSLGVVFYELLTGRRPFRADKRSELLDQIVSHEPRPPRQLDDALPRELERICLKALAKRPSERYSTASDLADELRQALSQQSSTAAVSTIPPATSAASASTGIPASGRAISSPMVSAASSSSSSQVHATTIAANLPKVVPKGLRSFDEKDADFFLELLPGARDREGLPTSIRFWKTKLETGDPDKTFAVALLYGPSGCGKSSLVKAGIVPRLARHVVAAHLEATPDATEARILSALRRICPELPDQGLVETFAALRRGEGVPAGRKIVLFVDQFEQWLHAHRGQDDTLLARALRQWDGARAQCVLMVRDDFWMSVTRFMRDLEVRLVEGANSAAVDLFSPRHARKVLAAFGYAFDALGANHEEGLAPEDGEFLKQAVDSITENGTVIPVRLALFAEMIKSQPWTTRSLKQAGGAGGIGAAFLEETFNANTAPPEHRYHQKAARNVLKSLMYLPGEATGIKGHMRSRDELLRVSGYARRPRDFDDLIRILDRELRLITPTEPDEEGIAQKPEVAADGFLSSEDGRSVPASSGRFYQLTHDYLVPSLRDWLTRKQRETRTGRAELRLEERSEVWNLKPNSDYLPAWWEVASILLLTKYGRWTTPERKMMRVAIRQQGLRMMLVLGVVGLAIFAGWEANGRFRAATLVRQIARAETPRVPTIVKELSPYRRWGGPLLVQEREGAPAGSRQRTNVAIALLSDDPKEAEYLLERALQADKDEFPVLRDELFAHRAKLVDRLWPMLESPTTEVELRTAVGILLAKFVPSVDPSAADLGQDRWRKNAPFLVSRLIETALHDTARYEALRQGLTPIRQDLVEPLQEVYHDPKRATADREIAMNIVELLAPEDPVILADVLVSSGERERLDRHLRVLQSNRDRALEFLHAQIGQNVDKVLQPNWDDPPLDPSWPQPDAETLRQIEAANGLVDERFAFCQTMPLDDFEGAAERLRRSGYRPTRFRPFPMDRGILVAAVWTRDASDWRLVRGLTADQVRERQVAWQADDFALVDLAGYLDGEFRFAVLAVHDSDVTEVDPVIGATDSRWKEEFDSRNQRGSLLSTVQVALDATNEYRHSQIWFKTRSSAFRRGLVMAVPAREKKFGTDVNRAVLPLIDVGVVAPSRRPSVAERANQSIVSSDETLLKDPNDLTARQTRAYWRVQLGLDQEAIDDLSVLLAKDPNRPFGFYLRAIVQARRLQNEAARNDLAEAKRLCDEVPGEISAETAMLLTTIANAYLDGADSDLEKYETILKSNTDPEMLLYAARAYGWYARALAKKDAARATTYADRSFSLVRQAVDQGFDLIDSPHFNQDLEGLLEDHLGFQDLLREQLVGPGYVGLEVTTPNRLAIWSQGLPVEEHLARCREMVAQQSRPVAIGVSWLGDKQPVATVSAWHRPILSEDDRDEFALRHTRAAAVLLRLEAPQAVWPLLRHQPDPRLRTFLIEALAPLGVDPQTLMGRLSTETDVDVRQAIVLSLGEYQPERFSGSDREALIARLFALFETDPDSGVHSAADFVLRKFGQAVEAKALSPGTEASKPADDFNWYVTSEGHTMAVIPGPVTFDMGAPYYELGKSWDESQHRRRIGRTTAIGTAEVTYEQFARFLADHPEVDRPEHRAGAAEPTRPIGSVTWYEAAQYCRWLSERERLTEDEMCFPSIAEIKSGLQYDLEKPGYRLPTEGEWEHACRAGTSTAYHFGATKTLADQYGWYADNSGKHLHPVGMLKPNRVGLFDVTGNADEWCLAAYQRNYSPPIASSGTTADSLPSATSPMTGTNRVMRGGEIGNPLLHLRSANRKSVDPAVRDPGNGFRVARTLAVTPQEDER
jgi:serine/threonine protein kinase/formylglycine-generating enzyme required for sulfatase activity